MFHENFKRYRKLSGLTQEEVAHSLMVTPQAVSKWETGNGTPDISLLLPIAALFHTTTDVLLGKQNDSEQISERLEKIDSGRNSISKKYADCKQLLKENPADPAVLRQLLSHIAEHFEYGLPLGETEKNALIADAQKYAGKLLSNPQFDRYHPYAHRRLADIYLYNGLFEKAEEEISHLSDQAVTRNVMLGKLMLKQNKQEEGLIHLQKAMQDYSQLLGWCAKAMQQATRGNNETK